MSLPRRRATAPVAALLAPPTHPGANRGAATPRVNAPTPPEAAAPARPTRIERFAQQLAQANLPPELLAKVVQFRANSPDQLKAWLRQGRFPQVLTEQEEQRLWHWLRRRGVVPGARIGRPDIKEFAQAAATWRARETKACEE